MRHSQPQKKTWIWAALLGVVLMGCAPPPTTIEDLEEVEGKFLLRKTGEPFTGQVYAFFTRDQKRWERSLEAGLPHGLEIRWNQTGEVLQEMSWEKGELREWLGNDELFEQWFMHDKAGQLIAERTDQPFTGIVRWLRVDGEKSSEASYLQGRKSGPFTQWHGNGQEACRGTYREGIRMPSLAWDLDGNPTLLNGSGWVNRYYEDGRETEVAPYVAGILEGQLQRWHFNGVKKSEISYEDGQKHGIEKEWHDNGSLRWERHWKGGQLHGKDIWWSPDGEVLSQSVYTSGPDALGD